MSASAGSELDLDLETETDGEDGDPAAGSPPLRFPIVTFYIGEDTITGLKIHTYDQSTELLVPLSKKSEAFKKAGGPWTNIAMKVVGQVRPGFRLLEGY